MITKAVTSQTRSIFLGVLIGGAFCGLLIFAAFWLMRPERGAYPMPVGGTDRTLDQVRPGCGQPAPLGPDDPNNQARLGCERPAPLGADESTLNSKPNR